MSRQLQFDFGTSLGSRPPVCRARQAKGASDRLMFRLHPGQPGAMAATVDATCRAHGLTGKPCEADRLHVSLVGFDNGREIEEAAVQNVSAAAATVRAPAFDLAFDRIISFRSGKLKPLVLLCGESADLVVDLERRIVDALNGAGLGVRRRAGFVPHCTVLYDNRLVPETRLDRPIIVPVTEFHLLHRKVGGWRRRVGSWPLLG
ncbi:2'-5' RNA ligase family protein [Aminobacter niigataensis]|uniref:2'-5' RNA ligase family protein n=1 Tax=Aminobacter niigataensis TaxID=83265 RepID=UPI0024C6BA31|nr:2'-5' RNA ligase family protein [Aminobacter niigataensis]CAI2935892.1 putative RNA 2',3'-cyclic 3'-phosphodiesterase [Aminobacter niigataensis]